ncbi:MAG: hypothetical protein ACN4GR_12600, partial [Arenicellales bacterium]
MKLEDVMTKNDAASSLQNLEFDNTFTRELPADPEQENHRRQVEQACFSRVVPKTISLPDVVVCSREVAALIDLPESACASV